MMKTNIDLIGILEKNLTPGNYAIFALKKGNSWQEKPIKFKNKKQLGEEINKLISNSKDYDLYFSPMPYKTPKRGLKSGLDTKYLIQDIDEVELESIDIKPSYYWESSPGKYQGIWELDRYISVEDYTKLNKKLAKVYGFDDCFDYPHVYRVPGSINHKYRNKPKVSKIKTTNKIYRPKKLDKSLNPEITNEVSGGRTIPDDILELLGATEIQSTEDRSSTLWYIENSLYDLGFTPGEIIGLVKNSIYNKYQGRADEDKRLHSEILKIISSKVGKQKTNPSQSYSPLKLETFTDVLENHSSFAGWLVEGIWGRKSHGVVAGMPKTFKSTLVHDLAVSIASGKPFLNKFPVLESGPVIIIQNENADYIMKDRTERLLKSKNLITPIKQLGGRKLRITLPEKLPIYFINQQNFSISNEEHRLELENMIEKINPVLVIFDPLYLMFDGEMNSAKELTPVLNWLLTLKKQCGVMVIHHYNKNSLMSKGSRMMGSIVLYGWIESAWYLSKKENEEFEFEDFNDQKTPPIILSREFRMAGSYPDLNISLDLTDDDYKVSVDIESEISDNNSITHQVLSYLDSIPRSRKEISKLTKIDEQDLNGILKKLCGQNKVTLVKEGYIRNV